MVLGPRTCEISPDRIWILKYSWVLATNRSRNRIVVQNTRKRSGPSTTRLFPPSVNSKAHSPAFTVVFPIYAYRTPLDASLKSLPIAFVLLTRFT